jgi:hypothetical protein
MASTKHLGIVLFEHVEELDAVGPWEVLAFWTRGHPEDGYAVSTLSRDGGPVACSKGLTVEAHHAFADAPAYDVLLHPGGRGTRPQLADEAHLNCGRRRPGAGGAARHPVRPDAADLTRKNRLPSGSSRGSGRPARGLSAGESRDPWSAQSAQLKTADEDTPGLFGHRSPAKGMTWPRPLWTYIACVKAPVLCRLPSARTGDER